MAPLLRNPARGRRADRTARTLICAALFAGAARIGEAQTDWQLEAALNRLRAASSRYVSAASISGFARQQIGSVTPVLRADATVTTDSVAAAQLLMGVNVLPPWTTRAPVDVGALVSLYGIAAGDRGQSRMLYLRQHLLAEKGGLWLGGAVSQIDREQSFASSALDVGAWIARGRRRFTAIVSTTRTSDREVFTGTSLEPGALAEHVRVLDATMSVELFGRRVSFEGIVAERMSLDGITGSQTVATATIRWKLTQRTHLTLSGGSQFADPLRGVPQWRFGSVGVRVANPVAIVTSVRARTGPAIDVVRTSVESVRFSVVAPDDAQRVEIVSTFTGGQPVALERGATDWVITLPVRAGPYRVQIRVDGGEWRVPANLRAIADEFGGRVGLIVVP